MGEHGRFEQIVSQFLLKSLHVILDSRVPSIRTQGRNGELVLGAPVKKTDKWFSLVLGDRPAALENLNFWHRNLMEPMIIDILLVQEVAGSSSGYRSPTALGFGKYKETVIERWVVQYEHLRALVPQYGDPSSSYKKTYKKSIILLRSLYSLMRLLPAYRVLKKLCSSSRSCDFDLNYKVFSFSSPLSREEEETMKQYRFSSIDAPQGRLSVSVTYRESLSDLNLDISASFPPQIITDYVGSPTTDPFRAFPSLAKAVSSTNSHFRGVNTSPPSPLQRPHSWTGGGIFRASSSTQKPLTGSPPVHRTTSLGYDSPSAPNDVYGCRFENFRLSTHHHTPSLDEYQLSPPFSPSPSPSPSPPTYFSGTKSIRMQTHSGSAPVSIPHPMMSRSPRYPSPNFSDPDRHSLPPLSPRSTRLDPSSQDSRSGIRLARKDSDRAGDSGHKILKDSREDSGRFSALLSSSSSPHIGFSRSSSRLSFQDDLDEGDFSCPFIVDDVDSTDTITSHNLEGKIGFDMAKKSQETAVGSLVIMLKNAPPLRQDSSCYSSHSSLKLEAEGQGGASSGSFMIRKTSDAIEELLSYKTMRDLLLSKSGTNVFTKQGN